ncbi:hypothetical protein [Ensifer sp. Root31]|uniref:hypothetical protein n=1 Tax=Ensifer sp. Root31 TaxID=1736512 RepID=UPI003297A090
MSASRSRRRKRSVLRSYSRRICDRGMRGCHSLVASNIATRQVASAYLKTIAEQGLLQEIEVGRENLNVKPALLSLLSKCPADLCPDRTQGAVARRQRSPIDAKNWVGRRFLVSFCLKPVGRAWSLAALNR